MSDADPAEPHDGPRPERAARLRSLPKIDALLARDDVRALDAPRWAVTRAVRDQVAALRQAILDDRAVDTDAAGAIAVPIDAIAARVRALLAPSLRRVVNATGVVLHTNLGRAPLAPAALDHVAAVACGFSNLEYELDAGRRGSRHGHLGRLLTALTGAEDAVVVNNNAAAVMLCLAALAAGREVIVSRGELVEIGGSFRVPDVMRLSGARLVEVGTTNKTRIGDYDAAITADTALLLKVHPSNFAVVGFTHEASLAEVAALARQRGLLSMMDLGSGSLLAAAELRAAGMTPEPGVAEVVASGVDVVTFSGDKLLGGPQAGILCGRRALIERLRTHPLMRALRPDKMTLAALEATLALYRDGAATAAVPALAMLHAPAELLRARAERIVDRLPGVGRARVAVVACESRVGGGAMPLTALPSWAIAVEPGPGASAADIEAALRGADVPVIARIADERVLLDMRTVADRDEDAVARALAALP